MQAFGLGRFWPFGHRDRDCVQCLLTDVCSDGRLVTSCAVVVGDQMAAYGPRSATCVRVFGWQTQRHNESEGRRWSAQARVLLWGHIVNRSQVTLWRDLSESVPVATRKMLNYA